MNYQELIHSLEGVRLQIINHKSPGFLMVFPNG